MSITASAAVARSIVFVLMLAATAAAMPAGAQNLLVNSRFDTDIAGWSPIQGVGTADWSSLDAAEQPGSGSLRLTNSGPLPNTAVVISQCVPVQAGAEYTAAADFHVPSGQPSRFQAYIGYGWYPTGDCSGTSPFGSGGSSVSTTGRWVYHGDRITVPAGIGSVELELIVFRYEAATFVVHVDNVVFGRVGTVLGCDSRANALCLHSGRFRVTASWKTSNGATGPGRPVPLTAETGYFWFFGAANVEVILKVLDACVPPYDRYWVFASGLTNVFVRLEVTDTVTGAQRVYENPQGRSFQPILDTSAFATCH
jgi:hypothetical protein